MKICVQCGAEKAPTEFYRKAVNRLGNKCKECHKAQVRAYQVANRDYYRQIDKVRAMLPHRIAARQKWEAKYPERNRARRIVQNEVKAGRLVGLPCLICGGDSEAHHPDYSAPLDVVWLCRLHHKQAHAMAKAA